MKNVIWTNNVCTVGGTCIHGYFDGIDLTFLLSLCPEGYFTPTFYCETLNSGGFKNPQELKKHKWHNNKTLFDVELGYYFTFMDNEGEKLIKYLKKKFPPFERNRR
jgi:hypothetical protein